MQIHKIFCKIVNLPSFERMSYTSISSSKVNNSTPYYNENFSSTVHQKTYFQKDQPINYDLNKKIGSFEPIPKFSYSLVLKDKSPEECLIILKEIVFQMENISKEIQRVSYISEELMNENMIWKEEYNKLKMSLDPNSNDGYEKNFIRRLADIKSLTKKKDEEINRKIMTLKKLENENGYLKREIELKKDLGSNSPLFKNDLRSKIVELENKNTALIKEINIMRNENGFPQEI